MAFTSRAKKCPRKRMLLSKEPWKKEIARQSKVRRIPSQNGKKFARPPGKLGQTPLRKSKNEGKNKRQKGDRSGPIGRRTILHPIDFQFQLGVPPRPKLRSTYSSVEILIHYAFKRETPSRLEREREKGREKRDLWDLLIAFEWMESGGIKE